MRAKTKIYVFFSDAGRSVYRGWVNAVYFWFVGTFLKKGFTHCFVVKDDEHLTNAVIIVERAGNKTTVDYAPKTAIDFFKENHAWVMVDDLKYSDKFTIEFLSCVTLAKNMTGVSGWIFTPWQLYKKLKGKTMSRGGDGGAGARAAKAERRRLKEEKLYEEQKKASERAGRGGGLRGALSFADVSDKKKETLGG